MTGYETIQLAGPKDSNPHEPSDASLPPSTRYFAKCFSSSSSIIIAL